MPIIFPEPFLRAIFLLSIIKVLKVNTLLFPSTQKIKRLSTYNSFIIRLLDFITSNKSTKKQECQLSFLIFL